MRKIDTVFIYTNGIFLNGSTRQIIYVFQNTCYRFFIDISGNIRWDKFLIAVSTHGITYGNNFENFFFGISLSHHKAISGVSRVKRFSNAITGITSQIGHHFLSCSSFLLILHSPGICKTINICFKTSQFSFTYGISIITIFVYDNGKIAVYFVTVFFNESDHF